jgi:hypothetical protein
MKIAYIFHGHSRTWKDCYQNFFDNVYSVAPGDIFIHTWSTVNSLIGSHWNGWKDLEGDRLEISKQIPDLTGIVQSYNPKMLIVEDHPVVDVSWCSFANDETKAQYGIRYMLYSSRSIFEIARNSNNYDFYFSTRLDVNYKSKIKLEEFDHNARFSTGENFDVFSFGPEHQMNIKTNFYHRIDDYWYNNPSFQNTGYEPILKKYLNDNNVNSKIRSDIQFELSRLFNN